MSVCCSLVHVKKTSRTTAVSMMKADCNREGGGMSVRVSQIKVLVCV